MSIDGKSNKHAGLYALIGVLIAGAAILLLGWSFLSNMFSPNSSNSDTLRNGDPTITDPQKDKQSSLETSDHDGASTLVDHTASPSQPSYSDSQTYGQSPSASYPANDSPNTDPPRSPAPDDTPYHTPQAPSAPTTKYCAYTDLYGNKTPQQLAEESPLVIQYKDDIERAQSEQRQYASSTSPAYKQKYDAAVFAEQKATNLYNAEYAEMLAYYQSMLDLCD